MKKEDCFYLGHVSKTHGLKGELTIKIDADTPEAYLKVKCFFLEINKVLTPFFIKTITLNNDKFYIGFQDIDDVQKATRLVGKPVYLPVTMLPKLDGKQFYYHEVKGFKVADAQHGEIGTINEIIEYPTQAIIQILVEGKEVLIPVIDEVIQKVDRNNKTLYIKAPEGLIDMYLQ